MEKCPNFDFTSAPYIFVRTRGHILLVDVSRKKLCSIAKVSFEAALPRQAIFEVFPDPASPKVLNLVTLEYHARTSESSVKRFTFDMAQASKVLEKLA